MARGKSGRIVIEVEPDLKNELYESLARSGKTLKDWFVETAVGYCEEIRQPKLFKTATSSTAGLVETDPGINPSPVKQPKQPIQD